MEQTTGLQLYIDDLTVTRDIARPRRTIHLHRCMIQCVDMIIYNVIHVCP